ncbi:MAG: tetratricopeptide repeat protein [Geodermatophilaceae bacterium]|nr:tetratricopeptide repeat protein [Geodermatophilaceae bacterium]
MNEEDWPTRAVALVELGRLDDAEKMATRALASDPDSHAGLLTLVLVCQQRGDLDGMQRMSRRLVAAHPDKHEGHILLSAVLSQNDEWEAATEAAERAVWLAPDDPSAFHALATALAAAPDRSADAIHAAEEAGRLAPDHPWPWLALSGVYARAQRFSEAIDAAQRALTIDPTSVFGRILLAVAYLCNGDHAEALNEFRLALSQEPTEFVLALVEGSLLEVGVPLPTRLLYEQVRAALGHPDLTEVAPRITDPALVKLRCAYAVGEATYGDAVRAGQIVASVLRDVPGQPAARRLAASLAERSGELATAARLAEELLLEGMPHSGLHHVRTHSLQRLDRLTEALDALSDAIAAHPQLGEFPLRRAEVLASLGRTLEARDWVDRAISIDPGNQDAQDLAARLATVDVQ